MSSFHVIFMCFLFKTHADTPLIEVKVHLTPKFFFAKTNPLIFCGISVQKFFDLVKSSIFCALLKYGKSV